MGRIILPQQPTFKELALREGLETPEGVVLHAFWQKTRGRKPSLPYGKEKNPLKALKRALLHSVLIFEGNFLRRNFWYEHGSCSCFFEDYPDYDSESDF